MSNDKPRRFSSWHRHSSCALVNIIRTFSLQVDYSRPNFDGLVKSQKTPSPLTGEGWGEGEKSDVSKTYIPLPLIPSRQGRGKGTFYEFVNFDMPYRNNGCGERNFSRCYPFKTCYPNDPGL